MQYLILFLVFGGAVFSQENNFLEQINKLLQQVEFTEQFVNPLAAEQYYGFSSQKSYLFQLDTQPADRVMLHLKERVTETRSTPFFVALSTTQEFDYQLNMQELQEDNIGISSWSWDGQKSLFYIFMRCQSNRFCVRKQSVSQENQTEYQISLFELRVDCGDDYERAYQVKELWRRFLYTQKGRVWSEKQDEDFGIHWNPEPDDEDDFNPLY